MPSNPHVILITGGIKSGKSDFALRIAEAMGQRKAFLATAQPLDDEMRERIKKHRERRSPDWYTVEEPLDIEKSLAQLQKSFPVILLDCLTLWLSNLMTHYKEDHREIEMRIEGFLKMLSSLTSNLLVVSNEVGMGIVPDNSLARAYLDLLGQTNQRLASQCTHVIALWAGLPLYLKGSPL